MHLIFEQSIKMFSICLNSTQFVQILLNSIQYNNTEINLQFDQITLSKFSMTYRLFLACQFIYLQKQGMYSLNM